MSPGARFATCAAFSKTAKPSLRQPLQTTCRPAGPACLLRQLRSNRSNSLRLLDLSGQTLHSWAGQNVLRWLWSYFLHNSPHNHINHTNHKTSININKHQRYHRYTIDIKGFIKGFTHGMHLNREMIQCQVICHEGTQHNSLAWSPASLSHLVRNSSRIIPFPKYIWYQPNRTAKLAGQLGL